MNENQPDSLNGKYFDDVYQANSDPWGFETSPYEHAKYAASLGALPRTHYPRAFEIGCSLGVFTAQLAQRCDHLLGVDVSAEALAQARRRCADLPQVTLQQMQLPDEFPQGPFDLITLCEVGYYWNFADLARAADCIAGTLPAGGQLLLVHWTPPVHDYPLTGDEVHEFFLQKVGNKGPWTHLGGQRHPQYRLDVLEKR
ncbi:class I SAM-dependent DNA methyltransferase [Hymenobacter coccineus]|uniref:Methyltransferase n=1 Tax=Hymenobacter coccineus TaxID=1908235 RepID=A0A1G1TKC6_9BACT|nr:class I SAM-dependent methyltransferase [Hymenobacter coccineus]OGX91341.1 methyltransferase [Hymenobacter coccineus]